MTTTSITSAPKKATRGQKAWMTKVRADAISFEMRPGWADLRGFYENGELVKDRGVISRLESYGWVTKTATDLTAGSYAVTLTEAGEYAAGFRSEYSAKQRDLVRDTYQAVLDGTSRS